MIYARRLNGKQRQALKGYENISGFEPMFQEDLDSGEKTFVELWNANIAWLQNVVAECSRQAGPGTGVY